MSVVKFKCPERGCSVTTDVWVPNYPQHESEHNADAACKEHKEKYEKIHKEHVEACERLGIRP